MPASYVAKLFDGLLHWRASRRTSVVCAAVLLIRFGTTRSGFPLMKRPPAAVALAPSERHRGHEIDGAFAGLTAPSWIE